LNGGFLFSQAADGTTMASKRFVLDGTVDTDNPAAIGPALQKIFPHGSVSKQSASAFKVKAALEGESAKDLNREILSGLRRAEKKTRLRAEWKSEDGTVQRFFDYVLKKTIPG
jgi:hypothetical protein